MMLLVLASLVILYVGLHMYVLAKIGIPTVRHISVPLMMVSEQFFYLMNFGINVLLYSLSGKAFRRAMAQLFRIIRNSVTRFVWKKYTMVRSKSTSRKTREHIDLGHL